MLDLERSWHWPRLTLLISGRSKRVLLGLGAVGTSVILGLKFLVGTGVARYLAPRNLSTAPAVARLSLAASLQPEVEAEQSDHRAALVMGKDSMALGGEEAHSDRRAEVADAVVDKKPPCNDCMAVSQRARGATSSPGGHIADGIAEEGKDAGAEDGVELDDEGAGVEDAVEVPLEVGVEVADGRRVESVRASAGGRREHLASSTQGTCP